MKSQKARDSRRRSRSNFFVKHWCYTTRCPPFSDPILFDPFESVMGSVKSFVRFFSYYDASLISDEDYIILYELLSSRARRGQMPLKSVI